MPSACSSSTRALRTFCSRSASCIGALLFSCHWYLVYISRIYEIATFIPFFFSIVFFSFLPVGAWRSSASFACPLFIGGIGLDCYAPAMAYGLIALWLILIYRAIKKQLRGRCLPACMIAFAVASLPFCMFGICWKFFSVMFCTTITWPARRRAGYCNSPYKPLDFFQNAYGADDVSGY